MVFVLFVPGFLSKSKFCFPFLSGGVSTLRSVFFLSLF